MPQQPIHFAAARLAVLVATSWLAGAGPGAADDRTLTVATWGGAYEHSQKKAYFEPFTAKTGIRIRTARYNGGLADLRRQRRSGRVDLGRHRHDEGR